MQESENSFYFLGNYYQMTEIEETVFLIFFFVFTISISLFFIIKIYKRRRCPNCKKYMNRDINDENEAIYICNDCNKVSKTGIFYGADDS